MAPSKPRNGHDDSKSESTGAKEKNSHAGHHLNGKLRRVASSTGSNLREVTNAAAIGNTLPSAVPPPVPATEASAQGIKWADFDRDVLHAYRRHYGLKTPPAFHNDYHSWVLTRPGSVGLYSPTVARQQEQRRQTRDQLCSTVRKHFNSMGVQENEVVADFLHTVRTQRVGKGDKTRRLNHRL